MRSSTSRSRTIAVTALALGLLVGLAATLRRAWRGQPFALATIVAAA